MSHRIPSIIIVMVLANAWPVRQGHAECRLPDSLAVDISRTQIYLEVRWAPENGPPGCRESDAVEFFDSVRKFVTTPSDGSRNEMQKMQGLLMDALGISLVQ